MSFSFRPILIGLKVFKIIELVDNLFSAMSTTIEHSQRFSGKYIKFTFFLAKIHILKLHTKKFVEVMRNASAPKALIIIWT